MGKWSNCCDFSLLNLKIFVINSEFRWKFDKFHKFSWKIEFKTWNYFRFFGSSLEKCQICPKFRLIWSINNQFVSVLDLKLVNWGRNWSSNFHITKIGNAKKMTFNPNLQIGCPKVPNFSCDFDATKIGNAAMNENRKNPNSTFICLQIWSIFQFIHQNLSIF